MPHLEAEKAIAELEATGKFKVLRKLDMEHDPRFTQRSVNEPLIGLCLDTETTGLDYQQDKAVEIGIIAFEYDPTSGEILRICGRYSGLEDPGFPLSDEVSAIHGITDDMLVGKHFDDEQITALATRASLVIAHNADFDRKFVENRFPVFATLPWACSLYQINWDEEDVKYRSLEYLLFACCKSFFTPHRALDDAEAVLSLLLGYLPESKAPVFKTLLDSSAEVFSRIWAVNAPYASKELLKAHKYRWSDGETSSYKAWNKLVPQSREQKELSFLAKKIYPVGNTNAVKIVRSDALSRYSVRE